MSLQFFLFNNYCVRPLLLGRYIYCNSYEVPRLDKIILNITLDNRKDLRDLRLFYSMLLLELLCIRRPFIKCVKSVFRAKTRNLILVVNLDLRSFMAFQFLQFLSMYSIYALREKYVDVKVSLNLVNVSLTLSFNEVMNFLDIPPIFYKWLTSINITVLFKNGFINKNDVIDSFSLYGLGDSIKR